MSFGREIKDFLDAYGKGADRAQRDVQIKQTGEYYKTLAEAQKEKLANDPAHIYGTGAAGTPNLGARDTGAVPLVPGSAAPAAIPDALVPAYHAASAATGVPVAVLVAKDAQESQLGKASPNITQTRPSTAADPGYGVAAASPDDLKDPAKNIMFGAKYFAARAKAAGVTDWSNPQHLATALRAYNGGGDPNYVPNVMRHYNPKLAQAIPTDGEDQPEQFAATGGLIDDPTYNDKAEYFAQDAAQQAPQAAPQALPVNNPPMPAPRPAAVDATASSDAPAPATPIPGDDIMKHVQAHATLPEALHAGLMKLQDMFGLKSPGAIDDGSQEAAQKNFVASTAGVVPPAELDALHKAVDPDDKLTPALKNLAGINAVYQHYMSIGDIDKAQKAAASLIQTTRVMVATFGHDAVAKLKAGDVQGAVKSLQKADELTPTGTQIVPSKPDAQGNGTYVIKDTLHGKTLKTGRYTPGDLMAMAGIASNGTGYFNAVAKVASPALPDDPEDDSASKAAFTSAMGGLAGGAPAGAPRPGAIPTAPTAPAAAPAPASTTDDDDADGDEDTSSGGDTDKDAAGSPAAAAAGAGSGLPNGSGGVGGASGGGAATPPPQFNNAAYARMNKEHQQAYARAYSVQLQQWKASQPKAQKPEKPASMKEVNELADGVSSALDKHLANVVDPATLEPYGDVEKAKTGLGDPTYQAIRNLGIGIARQAGLPHDSAASAALQLVDVNPADPSDANFDYMKDKQGRPLPGPDGMVPVVVGTQAGVPTRIKLSPQQLAQVQIIRNQLHEKLADEAVKRDANPPLVPKILRGAADVLGGTKAALAGNGPSMAGQNSYAAAQRRARRQALPLGDTNVAGQ